MSDKRYKRFYVSESENQLTIYDNEGLDDYYHLGNDERDVKGICKLLNDQQELIEELKVSDEMGWKRAEHFEKKCPKELHNKKMYIKRLEYKIQKFKEMNGDQQSTIESLKKDLKTVIDSYDCERIGYCHKGEYCKKWGLNNDR